MKTKKSRLEVLLTLIIVGGIMGCSGLPETSLEVNSELERLQTKASDSIYVVPTDAGGVCVWCGSTNGCGCESGNGKCPKCNDLLPCSCPPCDVCHLVPASCTCHPVAGCPNCKAPTEHCHCSPCPECGNKPFYCDCPESSQPTPSVRCECNSARCSGNPETCTCKEGDYCKDNEECICRGHLGSSTTPTDPTVPPVTTTP